MIGIDLTRISRFKNASAALISRILHPSEYVAFEASSDKAEFLAARWAIKEALYKADNNLGMFHNFAITQRPQGGYTFPGYLISTSSEGNYYIAIVLKGAHDHSHPL